MIRLAEAADAPRISQLWTELVAYHAQFDAETFRSTDDGEAAYQRFVEFRLMDSDARILVAEINGELVGFVSGVITNISTHMFLPLRCGLITDIYVRDSQRRRGIGRALVERLALWFRAQGVDYFEWYVSALNPAALGFWRAIGGETTVLRMRATIPGDDR